MKRARLLGTAIVFLAVALLYLSQVGNWLRPLQSNFIVYSQAGTQGGGVNTGSTPPASNIVIPFVSGDNAYVSLISITNLGTTNALVSGKFYTVDGQPGTGTFMLNTDRTKSFADTLSSTTVLPNQTLYYTYSGPREWGIVTAGSGVSVASYMLNPNGTLQAQRETSSGTTTQAAFTILPNSGSYPNFAVLVNPGSTVATVTGTVLDINGKSVASGKVTIQPLALQLVPMSTLFGTIPSQSVSIAIASLQSDQPIAVKPIWLNPDGTVATGPLLQQ